MAHSDEDQSNPYAPSLTLESSPPGDVGVAHAKLVKDFRSQSLALGVLWVIFGLLCVGVLAALFGGAMPNMQGEAMGSAFAVILGVIAVGWLVSGVLALMKNIWGVYFGLVLSYLSLIGNVLQMSVCGIVILIVIAIQAHRVIGFANKMKSLGIPLNQKV